MNELASLRQTIINHFNISELRLVLNDIGVNHEDLGGGSLGALALSAVSYCNRRNCIPEFAKALASHKPSVDFSPWGAPPPKESLHGVLRQLLNEAFSTGDIGTLAFDVFPGLYGELEASPGKTRKIEIVVEAAIQNDAVLRLMEWVRLNNAHKYNAYFNRVDAALTNHQQKEPEYIPEVPISFSPKAEPLQYVDNATLLVLKMYARGLDDQGALAKEALGILGVKW
jgi:hypothetical protein